MLDIVEMRRKRKELGKRQEDIAVSWGGDRGEDAVHQRGPQDRQSPRGLRERSDRAMSCADAPARAQPTRTDAPAQGEDVPTKGRSRGKGGTPAEEEEGEGDVP